MDKTLVGTEGSAETVILVSSLNRFFRNISLFNEVSGLETCVWENDFKILGNNY